MKRKKKIFLLEDNPIHREVIEEGLQEAGYEVVKAQNLDEAEQLLKSASASDPDGMVDLFVLDINIAAKKTGGFQFSKEIRKNPLYQLTPILYISAHLDEIHKEQYEPLGPNDHILQKPFEFDVLLARIKELVKRNH